MVPVKLFYILNFDSLCCNSTLLLCDVKLTCVNKGPFFLDMFLKMLENKLKPHCLSREAFFKYLPVLI